MVPGVRRGIRGVEGQSWRQYVYFRRAKAYHGRYINVDSLRHRVTPQPSTPADSRGAGVLLRRIDAVGKLPARRSHHRRRGIATVQALAGPGARVEVTNFGETGHVFTQGMLELMLQLRARQPSRRRRVLRRNQRRVFHAAERRGGARPERGEPDEPSSRSDDDSPGTGTRKGWRKDLHSFAVLSAEALSRLRLVQRLGTRAASVAARSTLLSRDSAARSVARVYAGERPDDRVAGADVWFHADLRVAADAACARGRCSRRSSSGLMRGIDRRSDATPTEARCTSPCCRCSTPPSLSRRRDDS